MDFDVVVDEVPFVVGILNSRDRIICEMEEVEKSWNATFKTHDVRVRQYCFIHVNQACWACHMEAKGPSNRKLPGPVRHRWLKLRASR